MVVHRVIVAAQEAQVEGLLSKSGPGQKWQDSMQKKKTNNN
jgi:hypothetical protein